MVTSLMCENVAEHSCAILREVVNMSEFIELKQVELIRAVQDMINTTLNLYKTDEHHAPAPWLLENWWATLEVVISLSSLDHDEDPSTL